MTKIDWKEASRKLDKMNSYKSSSTQKSDDDLFNELVEKFNSSTNKDGNHSDGFRDFTKTTETKYLEPNKYVLYSKYTEKNCYNLARRFITDSDDSEVFNQYDHRINDMELAIESKISDTHSKDKIENSTNITYEHERTMMKAQQKMETDYYSYQMNMLKGYTNEAQENKLQLVDRYKAYLSSSQSIKDTFKSVHKKEEPTHYINSLGMTISTESLKKPSQPRIDILSQIQKAVKSNIESQAIKQELKQKPLG